VKPVAIAAVPLLVAEHCRASGHGHRAYVAARGLVLALLPIAMLSMVFGGPIVLVAAVVQRGISEPTHPLWVGVGMLTVAGVLAIVRLLRESRDQVPASWLSAWVPLALAIAFGAMPLGFPWYVTWSLAPALTRLDNANVAYVALTVTMAILLTWKYTVAI